MLFDQKEKRNDDQPKKRSLLGTLFNPDLGKDIRPIGENTRMFVRMLAIILSGYNLFPKDHPALQDESLRLTLGQVFAISLSRLSFTKENIPQIVLFTAVWGCLLFSALFVVTFLLSLLIGTAHAAGATPTTSMFVPPDKNCDLAWLWLDYLFLGKDITPASSCGNTLVGITPNSSLIQQALRTVLAYFSNAVLVLAGIILLYHLASMVVETAHTGKPMGRANQIWAPIRLVVAIGLLIPIGSVTATGGGLNTGQYAVIQMAKWGSGLASNVWNIFLSSLATGFGDLPFKIPPTPSVKSIVGNLVQMAVCKDAYNSLVYYDGYIPTEYIVSLKKISNYSCRSGTNGNAKCVYYNFISSNGKVSCGEVTLPPQYSGNLGSEASDEAKKIAEKIYAAHVDALDEIIGGSTLATIGQLGAMAKLSPPYGSSSPASDREIIKKIIALEDSYQNNLNQSVRDVYTAYQKSVWQQALSKIQTSWGQQGWVMAGSWFNTIARFQGIVSDGASAPAPEISPPSDPGKIGFFHGLAVTTGVAGNGLSGYQDTRLLDDSYDAIRKALEKFNVDILSKTDTAAQLDALSLAKTSSDIKTFKEPSSVLRKILEGIDFLGIYAGIWTAGDGTSFTLAYTANPLAELAAYGYGNITTGLNILSIAGVSSVAKGLVSAVSSGISVSAPLISAGLGALAEVAGAILGLLFMIGTLFLLGGVTLAFVVPLIPFIRFFFNVIQWFLIVIEAVVSAPLFALAHLSPYGDGLPGQMASKGYFFILSLFLRPVLTVIGLMIGLLLFFIAITFLNTSYNLAVAGSGFAGGPLAVISKIMYSIFYIVLAYICANTCFKTVGFLPDHALNWMGQQGLGGREMGDKNIMSGATGLAAAYVGDKFSSQLQNLSGSLSKGIGSFGETYAGKKKKGIQKQEDAKAGQIAAQRHDENMTKGGMTKKLDAGGNPVMNSETGLPEYVRADQGGNLPPPPDDSSATSSASHSVAPPVPEYQREWQPPPSSGPPPGPSEVWTGNMWTSASSISDPAQLRWLRERYNQHRAQGRSNTGGNSQTTV